MSKCFVRLIVVAVALLLLGALWGVLWLPLNEGRWPIAAEELKVNGIRSQKGQLSFFVPVSIQSTNSVLQAKPVHYLRPYRLEERVAGEWRAVPVRRKFYWAQLSSAAGLRRCLCRFVFPQSSGEYRALLVYRYRNRWDFFRRRMANRLPNPMGRWVLPQGADGAVWTEPFFVEFESEEREVPVGNGEASDEIPSEN